MASTLASLAYKTLIVLAFFQAAAHAQVENQASRLNDELNFLKQEASEVDVYVPEDKDKRKAIWFAPDTTKQGLATDSSSDDSSEDSVSFGMSGIQKRNHQASDDEMDALLKEVEEIPTEFQPLKKRRLRFR